MGDRANVYVTENGGEPGVYLYTHWDGTELPAILQAALDRGRNRWNDIQYLTRIIFSQMIKDNVLDETGYGISAQPGDGRDRVLTVTMESQTVLVSRDGSVYSFEEYVALPMDPPTYPFKW